MCVEVIETEVTSIGSCKGKNESVRTLRREHISLKMLNIERRSGRLLSSPSHYSFLHVI